MIGVSTGGRISELLGFLRVGDVYQNGLPVTDLLYSRPSTAFGSWCLGCYIVCPGITNSGQNTAGSDGLRDKDR